MTSGMTSAGTAAACCTALSLLIELALLIISAHVSAELGVAVRMTLTTASSRESKESLRSWREPRGVSPRLRLALALRDSFRMLSFSVFFSFSSLSLTVFMSSFGSDAMARRLAAQTPTRRLLLPPLCCWNAAGCSRPGPICTRHSSSFCMAKSWRDIQRRSFAECAAPLPPEDCIHSGRSATCKALTHKHRISYVDEHRCSSTRCRASAGRSRCKTPPAILGVGLRLPITQPWPQCRDAFPTLSISIRAAYARHAQLECSQPNCSQRCYRLVWTCCREESTSVHSFGGRNMTAHASCCLRPHEITH